MFQLSADTLRRLCQVYHYPAPQDGVVFFGLRGALPVDPDNHAFAAEHAMDLVQINHLNPRCTIGQWKPAEGTLAVFPGSTVPHLRHVRTSQQKGGAGANQLMTGYYGDYRKGQHQPSPETAHQAFKQTQGRPIRRTADDHDFDNDDRVEFQNPHDNLHSAWCMSISADSFASAGCQVVVGYPRCARRGAEPDAGPWKAFREHAYGLPQDSFPYALWEGRAARQVALSGGQPVAARLQFGSRGELVTRLQQALKNRGVYEGAIDDGFGERTLRALLKFQAATFGPQADDGIVGPITASALQIPWPNV